MYKDTHLLLTSIYVLRPEDENIDRDEVAAFVDQLRRQLDRLATSGTGTMEYGWELIDALAECDNPPAAREWSTRIANGVSAVGMAPDLTRVREDLDQREAVDLVGEYLANPYEYEYDFSAVWGGGSGFPQPDGTNGGPAASAAHAATENGAYNQQYTETPPQDATSPAQAPGTDSAPITAPDAYLRDAIATARADKGSKALEGFTNEELMQLARESYEELYGGN
jgi:hypothetical protein